MTKRWLTDDERVAWVRLAAVLELLPGVLDTQLRRDADLSHFEYFTLAMLSEAPDRTLRMTALAGRTNATLARPYGKLFSTYLAIPTYQRILGRGESGNPASPQSWREAMLRNGFAKAITGYPLRCKFSVTSAQSPRPFARASSSCSL